MINRIEFIMRASMSGWDGGEVTKRQKVSANTWKLK